MTFLGVVTDGKDEEYIINNIEKDLRGKSVKVISINNNSIENIKNVKFETILIDGIFIKDSKNKSVNSKEKREILKEIIKNCKNIILNSDIVENLEVVKNLNLSVITYGFNSKATITMSSLEDENMLVCLQRNITDIDGTIIEQQELYVNLQDKVGGINNTKRLGMLATKLFYKGKTKEN